ncbi:hypothetical protein TCE0_017r04283 [Talaromyces pinophilus]|uniref:Uncharacterized protein n=1 Tax=Talaromyces pinophilus TaxID=128442 RepID=A0A6V8H867_TALPI|nr:hypothetical protein TCE0_017r04283 [Talaromyces pinophilus]
MAEQTSQDVVNQTRSGGEPSSSDVPASKNDKYSAEGGEGRITKIEFKFQGKSDNTEQTQRDTKTMDTSEAENSSGEGNKDTGRNGSAAVATRALELNGVASLSDGGEDGGSLGGSDTDTSRNDGRQHLRTGSIKKPTAFKPVSFAKFAVPKAPGTSTTPKLGEKPTLSVTPSSASPQPSTRPRLVAKTTSGLGSSSKHAAAGLKGTSGGPDASQVWNKNRPAQPPPTKHLTDEELKQQYGIHMTSRIQEDGNGTESKWADIDDDEDDWAPETIEWNDGTKIKLTHNENAQPPPEEIRDRNEAKEAAIPAQPPAQDNTKILFSKSSTTVGPNATVLRLGANAERQQLQAKAAIASRSGSDKPILTTKSPAPVPMKSPWAALPPVEKVSPVNPPVQTVQSHHTARFQARDQTIPDKNVSTIPAREIAADDFNRSWREGQSNVPRELFNSQSGRYEPVSDTRKGVVRDGHMRPATVLQRPGHHEAGGPAEPSAAFQTYRSSHQEPGHWGRRRASSNVSGGSGSYGRRMSIGRPDNQGKFNEGRRGSQVNGVLEHSISPSETVNSKDFMPPEPPATQPPPNQAWQPKATNNLAYAPPSGQPLNSEEINQDTNQASAEDVILMQQRIMKEKRLEARQRRLEQEQKEEAERRERIRLKLEALGPAPDKEKENTKVEEQPETTAIASKPSPKDQPATVGAQHMIQSPPKPPVPEPSGEPKQYGMMRVHHPESVKKLVAANERATEKPLAISRRSISPTRDVKHDTVKTNGVLQEEALLSNDQNVDLPGLEDKESQWRASQNSSYSPWGTGTKLSTHSSPSSNMWKPLSSDKTLGNGTFDRNLTAFSHDLALRAPVGLTEPSPIGSLPNIDKATGPQPFVGARLGNEHKQSLNSMPPSDSAHAPYEPFQPIVRPRPIGPPNSQHSPWQADTRRNVQAATSAWGNFHSVAAKQDAEANAKFQREVEALRDEPPPSLSVTFSETWRQVRSGDQVNQREVIDVVKSNKATAPLPALHGFDASIDSLPFPDAHSRPFGNVPNRGSRFFPTITDTYRGPVAVDDGRPRSPSPPPPEAYSTHPAYSGDAHRPLVNLPIPKPIVRLPPKISQPPPKPPTFASMAATPLRPPQPSMSATSWQDRINGLFGKATPEKKHILAVASATKEPLEVQSHLHPAAVSFPQIREVDVRDAESVTSKEVEEEEAIFEDREAGSLPVVRVPVMAPPNAWHAALPPPARLRPKVLRPMQVHSVEPYAPELPKKDVSGNWNIVVHIPGCDNVASVALSKKLPLAASRSKGNTTFRTRKNTKPREPGTKYNGSNNNKRQGSSFHAIKGGEN